jgi:hypothetical protein
VYWGVRYSRIGLRSGEVGSAARVLESWKGREGGWEGGREGREVERGERERGER